MDKMQPRHICDPNIKKETVRMEQFDTIPFGLET